MPNVFPALGSYSGTDTTDYQGVIHDYADNTQREYYVTPAKQRTIVIPFTSISLTKRNSIESFYNANKKLDVFVYVWPEASAVDLSGVSATGRHTARMRGPLVITNQSTCRYDTVMTFLLKD